MLGGSISGGAASAAARFGDRDDTNAGRINLRESLASPSPCLCVARRRRFRGAERWVRRERREEGDVGGRALAAAVEACWRGSGGLVGAGDMRRRRAESLPWALDRGERLRVVMCRSGPRESRAPLQRPFWAMAGWARPHLGGSPRVERRFARAMWRVFGAEEEEEEDEGKDAFCACVCISSPRTLVRADLLLLSWCVLGVGGRAQQSWGMLHWGSALVPCHPGRTRGQAVARAAAGARCRRSRGVDMRPGGRRPRRERLLGYDGARG